MSVHKEQGSWSKGFKKGLKENWNNREWRRLTKPALIAVAGATGGGTTGYFGYDIEENTSRLQVEFNSIVKEELNLQVLSQDVLDTTYILAEEAARKERKNQAILLGAVGAIGLNIR